MPQGYCHKCGNIASKRVYNLSGECKKIDWRKGKEFNSHGKDVRRKIDEGKLPAHITIWPDDIKRNLDFTCGETKLK